MEPDLSPTDTATTALLARHEKQVATHRRLKGSIKRLTPEEVDQLVALSPDHTAAQLSAIFKVSPAAVSALLQRRGLEASRAHRLNEHAKRLIVTSTAPVLDLALAYGVSTAHVYALRREYKASLPGATPSADLIGRKVTKDMRDTILNSALSAYEAAKAAGVGIATVYNYRRDHKNRAAGVEDLV